MRLLQKLPFTLCFVCILEKSIEVRVMVIGNIHHMRFRANDKVKSVVLYQDGVPTTIIAFHALFSVCFF